VRQNEPRPTKSRDSLQPAEFSSECGCNGLYTVSSSVGLASDLYAERQPVLFERPTGMASAVNPKTSEGRLCSFGPLLGFHANPCLR
jgi:hypothetical protein